ncbi:DUF3618 domain-containing protein [Amycolatopsis sp. AA4]|uniref:DUF3618 domain-containing protein n=1 Tax=Actinomycetes TaxID=1760 RepID=UPI0001B56021|nr:MULTISPECIES: DUF3618 domain-containing protein [Actinomycetes]ATY11696.1 DUF3618 domain-containing protein [Amycolatopsis sp. AA4]EFL07355.1 predicted protein [Streptomyces sp. AA4]
MTDRKVEQARADRDVTREELAEALDALSQKLDVRTRAGEKVDATINRAAEQVEKTISAPAAEKVRAGAQAVRSNPLPLFAAVFGGVFVLRFLIRRRHAHRKQGEAC